jgi:hypothetical protein
VLTLLVCAACSTANSDGDTASDASGTTPSASDSAGSTTLGAAFDGMTFSTYSFDVFIDPYDGGTASMEVGRHSGYTVPFSLEIGQWQDLELLEMRPCRGQPVDLSDLVVVDSAHAVPFRLTGRFPSLSEINASGGTDTDSGSLLSAGWLLGPHLLSADFIPEDSWSSCADRPSASAAGNGYIEATSAERVVFEGYWLANTASVDVASLRIYSGRGLISRQPEAVPGMEFSISEGDANGNNNTLRLKPDIGFASPPETSAPTGSYGREIELSVDGIGPVQFGMTVSEAEAELGTPLSSAGGNCLEASTLPGVLFLVEGERIAAAGTDNPNMPPGVLRTDRGLSMASSLDDIRTAYPSGLSERTSSSDAYTFILTYAESPGASIAFTYGDSMYGIFAGSDDIVGNDELCYG